MTFRWHDLLFEGAFRHPGELLPRHGVYIIWCDRGIGWAVLDVGQSDDVRARVLSHERKDCWRQHCAGAILYAVHYTPGMDEDGRRALEGQIRAMDRPTCGEV